MKKISLLILAMVCAMVTHASESEFIIDDFTFTVTNQFNREVSISENNYFVEEVVIPSVVVSPETGISYTVTGISESGFFGCDLKHVTIPETVRA